MEEKLYTIPEALEKINNELKRLGVVSIDSQYIYNCRTRGIIKTERYSRHLRESDLESLIECRKRAKQSSVTPEIKVVTESTRISGGLSLGEVALELKVSVMSLLREMKEGKRDYSIQQGQFIFPVEETKLDYPSKKKLMEIGDIFCDEFGENLTQEQWNNFKKEHSEHINGCYIPSFKELKEMYDLDWDKFIEKIRGGKKELVYGRIKPIFDKVDKDHRNPNIVKRKGGKGVHKSIVKDISNESGFSKSDIRQVLDEYGLLDVGLIAERFSSVQAITTGKISGMKAYSGNIRKRKREKRNEMCQIIRKRLTSNRQLKYLGLPSVNFVDYALFCRNFNVDPKKSLVVERERKKANMMQSIIDHWNFINGGEIFNGLNLYNGSIEKALEEKKFEHMKFDLIFLDYEGSWSAAKDIALNNLFKYKHLDESSLLFITLNKSGLETARFREGRGGGEGYKTGDQEITIYASIDRLCKEYGYNNSIVLDETESSYRDTVNMAILGFGLRRSGVR